MDLLPESATGDAWEAAVNDSASVAPGFGSVRLSWGDFGLLSLGLPFPLSAGQTLTIDGPSNLVEPPSGFQFMATPAAADARVDTCVFTGKNCQLRSGQNVRGTLAVQQTSPLVVKVDLAFADPAQPDVTVVTVTSTLSFHVKAPETWCKGYGD